MAINKITNEQRELMRQKSAESLPDVPSSKGWTPKNFKKAITKPLFDNENSFFAFFNTLVEEIGETYYTKSETDIIESNLNYNIGVALDTSKSYTDLKYNELKKVYNSLVEGAPEMYDTLVEIANYIESDKSGASQMLQQINKNSSDIADIQLSVMGSSYKAGDNIKIENNVISVITTDTVEADNTKPITSGAVQATVGNIEVLLKLV